MLEFANIQHKAKQLVDRLIKLSPKPRHYFGFFTAMLPQVLKNSAMEEAITLNVLANRLDHDSEELLSFINLSAAGPDFTQENLDNYKNKILLGMYLLLWTKYDDPMSTYWNNHLIELFRKDLNIRSPQEMYDDSLFQSSLDALSVYCSFVYIKRGEDRDYALLNDRLGKDIQVNIDATRNSRCTSIPEIGCFTGIMCTLGLNNMS